MLLHNSLRTPSFKASCAYTEVNVEFYHVPTVPQSWTFLDIGNHKPFSDIYRSAANLHQSYKKAWGLRLVSTKSKGSSNLLAITGMTLENLQHWRPPLFQDLKKQIVRRKAVLVATEYYNSPFSIAHAALFKSHLLHQIEMVKRVWGKSPRAYFHPFAPFPLPPQLLEVLNALDFKQLILPQNTRFPTSKTGAEHYIEKLFSACKIFEVEAVLEGKEVLEMKEAPTEGFNHLQKDFFNQLDRALGKGSFPRNAEFLQDCAFLESMGSGSESQKAYDFYINCMNMVKHIDAISAKP